MADSSKTQQPHIALLPSSGMGHLTPLLRLASALINQNIKLTFITIHPTVSLAESRYISQFLTAFPQITTKELHLLPFDPATAKSNDPFFLQFEAIRQSASLLPPILMSSSPPLSALITDITLASVVIPITTELHLPNYILHISSAKMLSMCAYFPSIIESCNNDSSELGEEIEIPNVEIIPRSWIPPILLDFTCLFATQFVENGREIVKSNGVFVNTFDHLEPESLKAFNDGKVVNGMPPIIPVGPLVPCEFERGSSPLAWLDDQPEGSVVYVSFGSRTAMSREQIRELGIGLEKSGCRFVWVVKDKIVDKQENEGLEEILGNGFIERVKDKGLVLSHKSVSGFVSHCGWNSVVEAAWYGVRMLGWPQIGDHKICAAVMRKSGLGMWMENWGWCGERVVKGEEIAQRIREMMGDEELKLRAMGIGEEARKAVGEDGSSYRALVRFRNILESLTQV
ncbi:hypothetical protein ACHQM5_006489 [Ranunculus cassubicifolius]